jgi:protein O-GlcNAc transferase
MEPHMGPNDLQMFYNYLEMATNYFEFGSGGSTYQAIKRVNLQSIISIESDIRWYNRIKDLIGVDSRLNYKYVDIKAAANNWGRPGPGSSLEDWKKYSESICDTNLPKIDYILIDGRFRVACCLKSFNILDENGFIAFDDFLNRPIYHVVLNYFEIVKRTVDSRMVILKKRVCNSPSAELIEKYEKDFD